MKNAKKVILFLGAILLVAFGSFNTIGSKSNKNAVAETKEETTSKKESKKADAVAVAVENNGQVQNTVQGQPVEVTNVEGNVQGQPVVNQNVKQSHKKNKKNQKAVQANSEAKENVPAERKHLRRKQRWKLLKKPKRNQNLREKKNLHQAVIMIR